MTVGITCSGDEVADYLTYVSDADGGLNAPLPETAVTKPGKSSSPTTGPTPMATGACCGVTPSSLPTLAGEQHGLQPKAVDLDELPGTDEAPADETQRPSAVVPSFQRQQHLQAVTEPDIKNDRHRRVLSRVQTTRSLARKRNLYAMRHREQTDIHHRLRCKGTRSVAATNPNARDG